jgi:hypothetical protein
MVSVTGKMMGMPSYLKIRVLGLMGELFDFPRTIARAEAHLQGN